MEEGSEDTKTQTEEGTYLQHVSDLIARPETAKCGSVELNIAVGAITGRGYFEPPCLGSYGFTTAMDDALSLIPRNLGVTFHRFLNMRGRSWACVHHNYPEGTVRPVGTLARPEWTCSANTEELAICAAALKSLIVFELVA